MLLSVKGDVLCTCSEAGWLPQLKLEPSTEKGSMAWQDLPENESHLPILFEFWEGTEPAVN